MTFEWDDGNRKHLARHGVTPDEAEELFQHDPYEQEVQEDDADGHRFKLIGETDKGRVLEMLVTLRGESIRIITAWDAPKTGKKTYLLNRLRDYGY